MMAEKYSIHLRPLFPIYIYQIFVYIHVLKRIDFPISVRVPDLAGILKMGTNK